MLSVVGQFQKIFDAFILACQNPGWYEMDCSGYRTTMSATKGIPADAVFDPRRHTL